jgi:hypothetical protein
MSPAGGEVLRLGRREEREAFRRPAQRGQGNTVEVFGDLRDGDLVVRRGNDEIRSGTRITTTAAKT